MKELIEFIKYDYLFENLGDNSNYYKNMIYLDFNSPEKIFFFKSDIIETINDYYLPFYQNFDRLDD